MSTTLSSIFRLALIVSACATLGLWSLFRFLLSFEGGWLLFAAFFLLAAGILFWALRHAIRASMLPGTLLVTGVGLIASAFLFHRPVEVAQAIAACDQLERACFDAVIAAFASEDLSQAQLARLITGVVLCVLWVIVRVFGSEVTKPPALTHAADDDFKISVASDKQLLVTGQISITNHTTADLAVSGVVAKKSWITEEKSLELFPGSAIVSIGDGVTLQREKVAVLAAEGHVPLTSLGKKVIRWPRLAWFFGLLTLNLGLQTSTGTLAMLVKPRWAKKLARRAG